MRELKDESLEFSVVIAEIQTFFEPVFDAMAYSAEMATDPLFTGFLVDTISTSDKLVRYGKNNSIFDVIRITV